MVYYLAKSVAALLRSDISFQIMYTPLSSAYSVESPHLFSETVSRLKYQKIRKIFRDI